MKWFRSGQFALRRSEHDKFACILRRLRVCSGGDVDYAMLVKIYGQEPGGEKWYSPAECIGARKARNEGNEHGS